MEATIRTKMEDIKKQRVGLKDSGIGGLMNSLKKVDEALYEKFKLSYSDIIAAIEESRSNNSVHINTEQTILEACQIADRYSYSFYDSLIISAALECKCLKLYTEDLQHGQMIERKLEIVNPFEHG